MPFSSLAPRSPRASKRRSLLVGLGQMLLMSINIRNVAQGHLVFLGGFTVINTYVWVYMVRTVIHASRWEKFFYALGSAVGAVLGVLASKYLLQPYAFTHLAGMAF